jgi:hypothetical protein
MTRPTFMLLLLLLSPSARADLWGGDIPLLTQIVANTMNTLMEMRRQTSLFQSEMAGINDRIYRIQTISEVIQPSSWQHWRDPAEALRRLRMIYQTLPKEYRSAKSDAIEEELSRAMNLIARVNPQTQSSFQSGKEMERRGVTASPGVAQKLTASGTGTLIAMEAQSLALQSHITSLLAQTLAEANEKESRTLVTKGASFSHVSSNLGLHDGLFSTHVTPLRMSP